MYTTLIHRSFAVGSRKGDIIVIHNLKNCTIGPVVGITPLRRPGGLHENISEIDFLIVSDRGDRYLSDAFGPMKKYCS